MEKIKQALQKARAGKEKDQAVHAVTEPASGARTTTENIERITYSQTRVQQVDERVLRKNRILGYCGNDEADTAFRMLRTQVFQKLIANDWNSLAVTSPGPGQGKTLTAINLALSLAREVNYTVLLVDFDLKRPGIHKQLGLQADAGISDFILHDKPLNQILVNPGIERLVILPGREALSNSSEMLKSRKMVQLVEELKSRYPSRIIVFDLPPLLSTDDALSFSPYVESFLLVIEEGETQQEEIEHSLSLLSGSNVMGTVLNKSRETQKAGY
ncbi:MAG: CpsD/CapB family tyrosine-protein kinase [Thiotrichales bacterium]|nr:CpsD/CapB family tyrosine-protein kinase [Thiotrichales bacterium]